MSSYHCFVPLAIKNGIGSQLGAGKGPQPCQVLGQEVHPGLAACSEHPCKDLPDNTVLRDLQGFFDVAFLGADNICVAQWFRSRMKCSSNVHSHSVFGSAGSALHGLCEDYA